MTVMLRHNQYGKAETRVVRVYRDSDPDEIGDYDGSMASSGDSAGIHLTGFLEGTVHSDDAPAADLALDPGQGWSR